MDSYRNLLKLKEQIQDREVYIWGAKITGSAATRVALDSGLNIKGLIDKNPLARARRVWGLPVLSPETFWGEIHAKNCPYIIVGAAIQAESIMQACEARGLRYKRDFCWAMDILGPVYEIDLTSRCNLRCPSCPQGGGRLNWPDGRMGIERFRRIVRHIKEDTPNVSYICLFCWTEPFLRRDLPDFVRVLKEEGVTSVISSNLSLDTPILKDVIREHPDYFRISSSGYYQETWQIDHPGVDSNLVKSNMFRLRSYVDRYSPDTFVEVYYHMYKYNTGVDMTKFNELCEELRFPIFHHGGTIPGIEDVIDYFEGVRTGVVESISDRLLFSFKDWTHTDMRSDPGSCTSFYNFFSVSPGGQVFCCDIAYDLERSVIAADIEKTSYAQLMEAKKRNVTCQKCLQLGLPRQYISLASGPAVRKGE